MPMQLFHDHLMEEGLSESNPVGRPFSRTDDGAGIGTDNASMPKRSSPPTGFSGQQETAPRRRSWTPLHPALLTSIGACLLNPDAPIN